jgi:hypothetical protein
MEPNYIEPGFSDSMGPNLRNKVEEQLSNDLMEYGLNEDVYKFDWSESCVEGKRANYWDGAVQNFSGIAVFNVNDEIVAEGWMEFIHDKSVNFFIAFWEYLHFINNDGEVVGVKKERGVPAHVMNKLPLSTRENIKKFYK